MAKQQRPLRRGWTTGTCATAAAKAAYAALLTGEFPDPVEVTLPRGERPASRSRTTRKDDGAATAGVGQGRRRRSRRDPWRADPRDGARGRARQRRHAFAPARASAP